MKERKKERKSGALEPTRLSEKEGEKTEEELGLRGTLFQSQCGLRSRRKEDGEEKSTEGRREGACPGIVCRWREGGRRCL